MSKIQCKKKKEKYFALEIQENQSQFCSRFFTYMYFHQIKGEFICVIVKTLLYKVAEIDFFFFSHFPILQLTSVNKLTVKSSI